MKGDQRDAGVTRTTTQPTRSGDVPVELRAATRQRETRQERMQRVKPWLTSSGPTSFAGKQRVARNAIKHGARSMWVQLAVKYCDSIAACLSTDHLQEK